MHRSSYSEYDRRGSSHSSEAQVERGVLDLLEKIRRCKGYLIKRLKHIEKSGQTRLLRDQVKSIEYWLEIAKEVRADMIYGVDTLRVVYNDLMEMIRLNPIQEDFNSSSRLDESDEDDDAPRSPSPSANEIDEGPRVIPMERSSDDYNRRDYMTSSSNRPSETSNRSGGHDNYPSSGDWDVNDYNRRVQQQQQQQHCDRDIFKTKGDTDMRFDSFSADTISIGRGRGLIRNDIDRRTTWNNNNSGVGAMDNSPYVRERSDDRNSGRQFDHYDHHNRRRDPSDERDRFGGSGFNRGGDVRSRETNRDFYGDEDLRDLSNERMRDISRERDRSRGVGDYYDRRDSPHINDNINRRNDFSEYNNSNNNSNNNNTDQDNRDPWTSAINSQHHHHQQHHHHHQQQQQQHMSNLNTPNPFAMNDNLNAAAAAAAAALQLQTLNQFGQINFPMSGFPGLQNVPMNLLQTQTQSHLIGSPQIGNNSPLSNLSGYGTQSPLLNPGFPINSNTNTVGPRSSLLPTPLTSVHPTMSNSQNFNNPVGQTQMPFGSPPLGGGMNQVPLRHPNPSATTTTSSSSSNRFDQTRQDNNNRINIDLLRQKASQCFNIRSNNRPRPSQPGHNNNNRDVSNSSSNVINNQSNSSSNNHNKTPISVGSNTTLNPNLATNQIVSDLPNDPRRRSQLERQKQLQQKQQQQSTSRSNNNNNNKTSSSSGSTSSDPRLKQQQQPQQRSSRLVSPPPPPDNLNDNSNPVHDEEDDDDNHHDYHDDTVGSSSKINAKKKREALQKPTSPTRKGLKQTAERVREKVAAKDQPKVSKLQQIREKFESNPVYRLGTKSKNIEDSVVQTQSEESSEKPSSEKSTTARRTSPRRDKSMTSDDTNKNNNNASSSGSSSSKQKQTRNASSKNSSNKESKSKRDKSPPKKNDRKAKQKQQYQQNSDNDEESEEEKSPTRKTRKSLVGATMEKSKDGSAAGASTNETQKFRIPKIRKPPTPSPPPSPPTMEDDEDIHSDQHEENSVVGEEDESLHEDNNMEVETSNNTSTSEKVSENSSSSSITEPPPSEPTASSSKTSNVDVETDTLLRFFMVKSVGLTDGVIDAIMNDPSKKEKLKSMLTDQVSKIIVDSAEDSSTSNPPSSPVVDQIKIESSEPVEDSGRQALSPNRVENEDGPTARGRSTVRKKPTKRRSSLEKLHDALREMNFDADLTSISRRPRRGATNRGQVEESIEHPSSSSSSAGVSSTLETGAQGTVEQQQSTIDEVIESVANDSNNISSSGGDTDMDESSTSNNEIGKGGNLNKSRKRKRVSVGAGKRRTKKSATTTTTTSSGNESTLKVTEAEAIAAVAAVRDFEGVFTGGEPQEIGGGAEGEEEMEMPHSSAKTTPKKKGAASSKKKSKKSPTKTNTATKSNTNNNDNEDEEQQSNKRKRGDVPKKSFTEPSQPPTEGRVLRPRGSINTTNSGQAPTSSRIQQPNVFINPNLMKVKMEVDYVPVRGVKVETSDPSHVSHLIHNQEDQTENNDNDDEDVEDNNNLETPASTSSTLPSTSTTSSSPKGKSNKKNNSKSTAVAEEKGTTRVEPDKEELRSDCSYDKSVFLGSASPETQDSQVHVPSHEKLLTDPGAPFVVKKIFPGNLFDSYLEDVFKVEEEENELKMNQEDDKISDKITQECKETLDWMLSVIQFRNDQDSYSLCSDSDDMLDLCDEVLDSSILNSQKCSVRSSLHRDFDNDDDDDDEEEEDEDNEDVYEEMDDNEEEEENESDNCKQKTNLEQNGNSNNKTSLDNQVEKNSKDSSDESNNQNLEERLRTCSLSKDGTDLDQASKDDKGEMSGGDSSNQDDDEGEVGRTTNLEGAELYRCANETCVFTAPNAASFKEHSFTCPNLPATKQTQCFHCEKKLKSAGSLIEHLKIHGKPRQVCSLCTFRCWISSELTKHLKNTHKVYNCKPVKEVIEGEDPIHIMYPKEVAHKMAQPSDLKRNHILYTSKVQFGPDDIESIPRTSIFTTLVHCSECEYSSKVRSNIVRHLKLHQISNEDNGQTKVPCKAPVNPVPCLERNELMFDKMTNWAGSSHDHNKVGGVSKEDTLKLPKFVTDQFRYMCSVDSCKQITGQDDILCSHMKALHFKEKYYVCPHCQEDDTTKKDPRNSVLIDKIQHHLKLHGPRLSKCGHCDYIHYSSTSMEKHVATKHVEKKPIFYLIRDYDNDGNPMNRRPSLDDSGKGKNVERWRCNLCKANLNSWDDAKQHCLNSHKSKNQFECSACHFGSDSIYAISNHMSSSCQTPQSQKTPKQQIMIMFHRNENYETAESKLEDGNIPIWRRDAPRVKHIRGIFLEEDSKPASSSSGSSNTSKAPPQPKSVATNSSSSSVTTSAPKQPSQPVLLVCPKCKMFKTKNTVDMKVHLFNEFNYQRYKCTICETKFVTVDSLKAHMSNDHKCSIEEESKAELPTNPKTESKVYDIINGQLKNSEQKFDDKDGRNVEILLCKHCFTLFSSYHNYRTHILAKHIGGERFRCKYCPGLGFWHEAMLRQHHQKSFHADKPLDSVRNTEFEETLSPEFWLKEYGIPLHKSINSVNSSRTIKQEVDETWMKCSQCEFTTESSASLRAHEVRHSNDRKSPTKRRRLSISDGEKNDMLTPTTIKREPGVTTPEMKRNNNMSSVFNCSNCDQSFFTKRGVRRHWVRAHSLDELPCRYYEVKSQSKNLTIMDGVCMLCRHCYYESSDAGHFQSHHEREHPNLPVRYKRKKRTVDANSEAATILVCSHCFCEFETLHKLKLHSQDKHPSSQLKYKTHKVNNFEKDPIQAVAKLLSDTVIVECTFCLQECGSRTKYENHYKSYHNDQEYAAPNFKYSRSVLIEDGISSGGGGEDDVGRNLHSPSKAAKVRRMSVVVNNNNNNATSTASTATTNNNNNNNNNNNEDSTTTAATPRSTVIKSNNNNNSKPVVKNIPLPVLHSCPKCEFQTTSLDTLASSHLLTHLLNYRCPICATGFHGSLDALFHIRHYHGEHRLEPAHDPTAYIEFTTLKNQVTANLQNSASNFTTHDILTINLSDEEDLDDDDLTLLEGGLDDLDAFDDNFQLVSL